MPLRDTGKQRASRIRMDYFKGSDGIQRLKAGLGWGALVVSLGWVAGAGLWLDRGRAGESRGPVASVHATWENRCTVCHVPFTPINDNSLLSSPASQAGSNQRCTSCHAGPAHHADQKPDLACGTCHRDHRGRDISLGRLPDQDCTQCHEDLAQHQKDNVTSRFQNSVPRFDAGHHPDFRSIKTDPGKLKFNHALHMTGGMARKDGGPVWRLKDIPEQYRQRYADQQKDKGRDDLVQLNCASCHWLDNGALDRPHGVGSGKYMQPITYENQCRACHALTFDRQVAGDRKSPALAMPHGLQPSAVRDFLWGAYANEHVAAKHPELLKQPPRPLPGKMLSADGKAARADIDNKLSLYEKYLYLDKLSEAEKRMFFGNQTCGECHHYEGQEVRGIPKRIVPTNLPEVWLKHATFDHSAHRAVDCRACHQRAYPDDPEASTEAKDVLLPGIKTCVQCHAPQTASAGGARFDCTECHSYHHRDTEAFRAQGRGAGARGPRPSPRGIGDFLSGVPPHKADGIEP